MSVDLHVIISISYSFLLISYIMRDILWLRVLAGTSIVILIPYFYFQPSPLWYAIGWNFAFLFINIYWVGRLLFDRRPFNFTDEQKRLWETAFHRINPRHARALFKSGIYRSVPPNEIIAKQGETLNEFMLISEGELDIILNQKTMERLGPGHFVGSAIFLERDFDMPSVTTVVSTEQTRMIVWEKRKLRKMADNDHQFSVAIEAIMGLDIASFVIKEWKRKAFSGPPSP